MLETDELILKNKKMRSARERDGCDIASKVAAFAVALLLVISTATCSRANSQQATTQVVTSPDPNVIRMEHPERFGLAEVSTRQVFEQLNMNGVVTPDVNRTVPVLSLSGGRAVDIRTRLGDDVKKGQVLVLISSPDLSSAFSDFQKAQANELLAQKQLQRAQGLYDKGAIAQKDLEVAVQTEQTAKVDLVTTEQHLHILGADPKNPSPVLQVRAPISGTVVEQNVTGGTGVRSMDNSPNLFTIADLSRVWVLCDAYEDTLTRIHVGDIADIRVNGLPDAVFKGQVSNIGRVLDPNTRTAKVRIELNNPGGAMRAGQFVTAMFYSRKSQPRSVIPTSAVVRLHDKDWVFVPLGGGRFRKTEVQLGLQLPDGMQAVLSGVSAPDKVVANALQFSSSSETE
jgi:cobalt-zinc-cadmium efflux system membrane fusion protein